MAKIKARHILLYPAHLEPQSGTGALQQVAGTDTGAGGTGTGGEIIHVQQFVTDGAGTVAGNTYVVLDQTPTHKEFVKVSVVGGSLQLFGTDFNIEGKTLFWNSLGMQTALPYSGMHFIVEYSVYLSGADTAADVPLDITYFDNQLTPLTSNIQQAMNSLDQHEHVAAEIQLPTITNEGILYGVSGTLKNGLDAINTHSHDSDAITTDVFDNHLAAGSNQDLQTVLEIVDSSTFGNTIYIAQLNSFHTKTIIRHNGTEWVEARANTPLNATGCWIVISATPTSFIAQNTGRCVIASHGFTPGTTLYLSPDTLGLLVPTKPVGTKELPLGFYLPFAIVESSSVLTLLNTTPKYNPVLAQYVHTGGTVNSVNFLNLNTVSYKPSGYSDITSLKFEITSSISGLVPSGSATYYGIDLQVNELTANTYLNNYYFDDGSGFRTETAISNKFTLSVTNSALLNDTVYLEGVVATTTTYTSNEFRVMTSFNNINNHSGMFCGRVTTSGVLQQIQSLRFFASASPDFQFMIGQNDYIRLIWQPSGVFI